MSEHPCPSGPRPPATREEARSLLAQFHQFPGEYTFKAIGFAGEGFSDDLSRAAAEVLGEECPPPRLSCRPSRGGRFLSVTLEVGVDDAEQVLAIYARLRQVAGLVSLF